MWTRYPLTKIIIDDIKKKSVDIFGILFYVFQIPEPFIYRSNPCWNQILIKSSIIEACSEVVMHTI